jgi:hypothetical protein
MRFEVEVDAEWATTTTYEFETAEEANDFREKVNNGGNEGLDATIDNETAELESGNAELINYSARRVRSSQ